MQLMTAIKIARLIVVLPIALVLVALLPVLEFCCWMAADTGWHEDKTWRGCADRIIYRISKFIWP